LLEKTDHLGLLTVVKSDPSGYGRIVRNEGGLVTAIVEHKDASEQQRAIHEVNSGIIAAHNHCLSIWLKRLTNNNAQQEFYLTDIVAMAEQDRISANREITDDESSAFGSVNSPLRRLTTIASEITSDEMSVAGVNSKQDLSVLERVYQLREADRLMQSGVTLLDPLRIDVRGELTTGRDIEIDIGCIFEGQVSLADNVKIGAYCIIKESSIGAGTIVAPYTHIDQAGIAADCRIGPYARLRPGTELNDDTHIGNFVELKNSQVDTGSKINHLSYVGDTTVGKQVNIGAGTITCNYDGANKFRTVIEDNAFIGSDSQLVAPVTIGAGATIAAGSTITKDAPAGELSISRGRQVTVKNWKRPQKIKK